MDIKKNILVLVDYFGQGGAEKVATMLAQMLHESGRYQTFLYAIHKPSMLPSPGDVKKGSLEIDSPGGVTDKFLNYYRKIRRLRKLKKELRINLTISSLWPVDWINMLTGRDKKISIIQINILNNEQNVKMVKLRRLVSWVYNRFDKIVLGSSNLRQELTDFFKIKNSLLQVVHNPIDVKLIQQNIVAPLPSKLDKLFDKYKILVAANRLHTIKNTESLFSIYQRIQDRENIKLLIIGEGEEKENLLKYCRQMGLKSSQIEDERFDETACIYFLNFQKNIHNLICRSKIFLFPTKSEGLPLALLESMHCGVPVLVSDCPNGGVFEVMEGQGRYDSDKERIEPEFTGGGYLMPVPLVSNEETLLKWTEKIEMFLDADEKILQSIRKHNKQRSGGFDKGIIQQQWFDLIEEVLKENE